MAPVKEKLFHETWRRRYVSLYSKAEVMIIGEVMTVMEFFNKG